MIVAGVRTCTHPRPLAMHHLIPITSRSRHPRIYYDAMSMQRTCQMHSVSSVFATGPDILKRLYCLHQSRTGAIIIVETCHPAWKHQMTLAEECPFRVISDRHGARATTPWKIVLLADRRDPLRSGGRINSLSLSIMVTRSFVSNVLPCPIHYDS